MKLSFRDYLKSRSFIRHCGATGTELMKLGGVTPGALNNMVCPEKVYAVQKEYVDAGVEISLTNTFAMNPLYAAVHAKDRGSDPQFLSKASADLDLHPGGAADLLRVCLPGLEPVGIRI